jgi:hypothetical protein
MSFPSSLPTQPFHTTSPEAQKSYSLPENPKLANPKIGSNIRFSRG